MISKQQREDIENIKKSVNKLANAILNIQKRLERL
jgi:hypothetical protein